MDETKKMNVILLHGAWHAAWFWNNIIPKLQHMNYNVLAPSLPGHFQRNAENPDPLQDSVQVNYEKITLKDYVEFTKNQVLSCTGPVVLVGHSMSGAVISQVAEDIPQNIKALVYLAAHVLEHGQTLFTWRGSEEKNVVSIPDDIKGIEHKITIDQEANVLRVNLSDSEISNIFYNRCSDTEGVNAVNALCPQPLKPFDNAVNLGENFRTVKKFYIACQDDHAIKYLDQKTMSTRTDFDKVFSLDTDHSPTISAPDALVEVLGEIIESIS